MRLVDGDNYAATEGRVEYCVGGRWGTVCNYQWSVADVVVVCRQLGLNTFGKIMPFFLFKASLLDLVGLGRKLSRCGHHHDNV